MPPSPKTTLKDLARETGFSVMTISNVLNGKLNRASPENRTKILAAAERLNYRPNLQARQLVTRENNVIGLLIDSTSPFFYRDVLMQFERIAFSHGYRLQIGIVHENFDAIRQYVDDFVGTGIDKVICAAHNYPDFGAKIPPLFKAFRQVVFLEEPLVATPFPVVATDHRSNHQQAVEELIRRGRRRIVCCRWSPYRDRAFFAARQGIEAGYQAAGLAFEETFWQTEPLPTPQASRSQALQRRLAELIEQGADALILRNDQTMFEVLRELAELNLRVPEDVALFSAELGPHAAAAMPSFSGFDYDAGELAQRLFDHLQATDSPTRAPGPLDRMPAQLVWGESCATPIPTIDRLAPMSTFHRQSLPHPIPSPD